MGRKPNPDRKPELLAEIVQQLVRTGVGDLSLRPLATALGVSTYTLTYHFGSREQLISEVVQHIEAEQHRLTTAWFTGDPAQAVREYWTWLEEPQNLAQVRLVLEVTALPAASQPIPAAVRSGLVTAWVEALAEALTERGEDPGTARVRASVAAAALAGLALDLLATGDHERTRAAAHLIADQVGVPAVPR
ncbi:TetR/AcrR family transcriptional regulator [Streptomyces sp. NPDC002926]